LSAVYLHALDDGFDDCQVTPVCDRITRTQDTKEYEYDTAIYFSNSMGKNKQLQKRFLYIVQLSYRKNRYIIIIIIINRIKRQCYNEKVGKKENIQQKRRYNVGEKGDE
jgi:hypothetical protein